MQVSCNVDTETLQEISVIMAKEKWSRAFTIGELCKQAVKERNRKKGGKKQEGNT